MFAKEMKILFAIGLMIAFRVIAPAETPSEVTQQLTKDLVLFVEARGNGKYTDVQILEGASKLAVQAIQRHPTAFEFSAKELQQFRDGKSLYSDEEIRKAYAELKSTANGAPMPVLVEYYYSQFTAEKLSAPQKAIFQKLTLAIINDAKKSKKANNPAQPATRPVDEPEGGIKPQREAEGRSR
jgi:hypothetical protein